jgi:hypothetical protein
MMLFSFVLLNAKNYINVGKKSPFRGRKGKITQDNIALGKNKGSMKRV